MVQTNKTRANHAFVVRGTLEDSDEIIELINQLEHAELVYQRHSTDKLFIEDPDADDSSGGG